MARGNAAGRRETRASKLKRKQEEEHEPAQPKKQKVGNENTNIIAKFDDVSGHDTHSSVNEISADFSQVSTASGDEVEIGGIITYVVGKTFTAEKGKKQWISELLAPTDDLDELSKVFQVIFTPGGNVRSKLKDYKKYLQASRIMFVHTFKLDEAYRGNGVAQQAMRAFFREPPDLADVHGYEGVIALSPAADQEAKQALIAAKRWTGEAKPEAGLIWSWTKSGFEVWLQGDPGVEGSVTIMGIANEMWNQ